MHTQAEDFYTHDSTTGSEQLQVFFFFFPMAPANNSGPHSLAHYAP